MISFLDEIKSLSLVFLVNLVGISNLILDVVSFDFFFWLFFGMSLESAEYISILWLVYHYPASRQASSLTFPSLRLKNIHFRVHRILDI